MGNKHLGFGFYQRQTERQRQVENTVSFCKCLLNTNPCYPLRMHGIFWIIRKSNFLKTVTYQEMKNVSINSTANIYVGQKQPENITLGNVRLTLGRTSGSYHITELLGKHLQVQISHLIAPII